MVVLESDGWGGTKKEISCVHSHFLPGEVTTQRDGWWDFHVRAWW